MSLKPYKDLAIGGYNKNFFGSLADRVALDAAYEDALSPDSEAPNGGWSNCLVRERRCARPLLEIAGVDDSAAERAKMQGERSPAFRLYPARLFVERIVQDLYGGRPTEKRQRSNWKCEAQGGRGDNFTRVRIASSVEAEPGTSRPGQGRGCACNSVQEGLLYIRTRSTERAYLRQGYNWCNKNISHDELYQHLFLNYTGYVRVSISRSDYKFF